MVICIEAYHIVDVNLVILALTWPCALVDYQGHQEC